MATFVSKLFDTEKGEMAYLLVFGYIRDQQKLFPLIIPDEVTIEFLRYFFIFKQYIFMNGIDILSRDWEKLYRGQMIEYITNSSFSLQRAGVVYKGKLVNIKYHGFAGSPKIILKTEDDGYHSYPLCDIKIKLEDIGIKINTEHHHKNLIQADLEKAEKYLQTLQNL